MAIFKEALNQMLKNEGILSNVSADRGGITKYGISLRFLQSIDKNATADSIKKLTLEEVEEIYFSYFWLTNNYYEMNSQELANKVFDTAVNMSPKVANRFLQKSINQVLKESILEEDGICGKKTIKHANLLHNINKTYNIINNFRVFQSDYYNKIVEHSPNQQIFLNGWLKRAMS